MNVDGSGDVVSRWQSISRIRRADGGLEHALHRYERVTRAYEARHIFGALTMLAISWWSVTFHSKGEWSALLAANMLINGYPIILQRYNRDSMIATTVVLVWVPWRWHQRFTAWSVPRATRSMTVCATRPLVGGLVILYALFRPK